LPGSFANARCAPLRRWSISSPASKKYNSKLNAVIWLDSGRAPERAEAADAALAKGEVWGPLHGVPMTIKESYNVAGSPTTWGDPKLANNVTETSASPRSVWRRLGPFCLARPMCR
jgi:Asp-tRNAAsn/Glu-tRNAGln amidotransferase A subunit and related amidases